MHIFCALLTLTLLTASEPVRADSLMIAPRVDEPIRIDGVLDEPAWSRGPDPAPFVRNKDATPAKLTTTGRIIHDSGALYVGIHCREPDVAHPLIRSQDRDVNIWGDDGVEVFLDPGQTRSRYYQIIVNAVGRAVAGFNGVYAPGETLRLAIHQTSNAWSVEMRIPFETLRVRPRPGDRWGLNLYRSRHARSKDDLSQQLAWHATRGGFRKPHLFGTLIWAGRTVGAPLPSASQCAASQQRILDQVARDLAGKGRWTPADMNADAAARRAERLMALSRRIGRLGEPALVAGAKAITDEPVFPWSVPAIDALDPVIEVAACPDEFEPVTFMLFAARDLEEVTVQAEEFVDESGPRLDPAVVDVKQVLCWYQSGWAHVTRDARTLVPELLVKDGSLIEVDPAGRRNKLNFRGLPTDSEMLKPFDLPAFEARQIWLTFHPPADAAPGLYRGRLRVREGETTIATVPVRLTVYPFKLAPSVLSYSLYYRLRPSKTPDPVATMKRMAAEIRNQVEHGINMPSTYVGGEPLRPGGPRMETLETLTRIYRDLGLRDHPLILVTTSVGTQSTPEQLENIRKMVRRLVGWAKARGYSDVYFQAIDEAKPEVLKRERLAFQAVHDAGGKVFVACGSDYFDAAGDLLDMPVLGGALRPDVAAKAQALGHRVFSYYNPQAGVELPEVYRRNYGLKLWVAGYDGGFNYEYQQDRIDHAYDEFLSPHYRNHTMAYPTPGRPIDTRQWEGWREGTDDVRYLSTLLKALDEAAQAGRHVRLVRQTREWLQTITGDEDLDALRGEMVRRIIQLRGSR